MSNDPYELPERLWRDLCPEVTCDELDDPVRQPETVESVARELMEAQQALAVWVDKAFHSEIRARRAEAKVALLQTQNDDLLALANRHGAASDEWRRRFEALTASLEATRRYAR